MQGQLFTQDFLLRGVQSTPPYQDFSDTTFAVFQTTLRGIFSGLDATSTINEAQTEQLLINKVLAALGWADDTLPQVNANPKGREAVPDCLLFASPQQKALAVAETKDDRRYRHGLAILEAKRWLRPLDRGDGNDAFDPDAPSSQMLRYLSRIEVASDRAIKWGMLTNGAVWRLYWQDARSRAEEFFEIDLTAALGVQGIQHDPDEIKPNDALRLFYLFFQREAFLSQSWDNTGRTFHAYALNEARLYEEKVSQDLGARVFTDIFPQLADALARGDLHAKTQEVGYGQFKRPQYTAEYLDEVREAALVLLYRLLFLFYAEDRNLLPVRDARYAPYSVRRLREEVRDKVDAGTKFSVTLISLWLSLRNTFDLVGLGDESTGFQPYCPAIFDRARSPLLSRTVIKDEVLSKIIDILSRQSTEAPRSWIDYRDLSVSQLGNIYAKALECNLESSVLATVGSTSQSVANLIAVKSGKLTYYSQKICTTHSEFTNLFLSKSFNYDIESEAIKATRLALQMRFSEVDF